MVMVECSSCGMMVRVAPLQHGTVYYAEGSVVCRACLSGKDPVEIARDRKALSMRRAAESLRRKEGR